MLYFVEAHFLVAGNHFQPSLAYDFYLMHPGRSASSVISKLGHVLFIDYFHKRAKVEICRPIIELLGKQLQETDRDNEITYIILNRCDFVMGSILIGCLID